MSQPETSDAEAKREALALYSVRLRPDQVRFLKGLANASEWLRHVIDDACVRESAMSTGNRVILLTQQIKDLEQQITSLAQNPAYLEAKVELDNIHKGVEQMEADIKRYEAELRGERPPGQVRSLESMFAGGGLEGEISKLKEWAAKGLEAEAKPKAIIQGFEQEIQTLTAKRELLEKDLLRESQAAQASEGGNSGTGGTP